MSLDSILNSLSEKKTEFNLAKKKLFQSKVRLMQELKLQAELEKVKSLLLEISKQSQQSSIEYIEKLVSYFIKIYGEQWSFKIEVKTLHDQQEFHFRFMEGDIEHYIKDDIVAGGIIDMANIGLRIASHSLDPEAEPMLFLDEPFKNLGDKIEEGMQILKDVAKERKIQLVIITHDQRIMGIGDSCIRL